MYLALIISFSIFVQVNFQGYIFSDVTMITVLDIHCSYFNFALVVGAWLKQFVVDISDHVYLAKACQKCLCQSPCLYAVQAMLDTWE